MVNDQHSLVVPRKKLQRQQSKVRFSAVTVTDINALKQKEHDLSLEEEEEEKKKIQEAEQQQEEINPIFRSDTEYD